MPDIVKVLDEKKFMWDGKVYETRPEAEEVRRGYAKDGFEAQVVDDGGKSLVYTRRVAAQQTADAQS